MALSPCHMSLRFNLCQKYGLQSIYQVLNCVARPIKTRLMIENSLVLMFGACLLKRAITTTIVIASFEIFDI